MPPAPNARPTGDRLLAAFRAAGAVEVAADILQPAEILLDLYGEDIRARAYTTTDPLRGEMMLRPDFTVPVVQMHMAQGQDPARYCYLGEVFRRQDHRGPRTAEYLQVGYEVFARDDPAAADAEVFALFARLLAPLGLRPATGDIGILIAAVQGLSTTDRRRAALIRHIWRPARFRALLDRFAGRGDRPARGAQFAGADVPALIAAAGPEIGVRSAAEVADRVAALTADTATPPLPAREAAALDTLLSIAGPSPDALATLRGLCADLPALTPAVARFAARLDALAAAGVDPAQLPFEASHGRTTLEYYDGFVFSFHATDPALPPVASGGRYDALTARLGDGRSIPAVGGVIRPGLFAQLGGGAR